MEETDKKTVEKTIDRTPKVRPDVVNYDDIRSWVPALDGKKGLVEWAMRLLAIDEVNRIHGKYCYETGVPFSHLLIEEEFKVNVEVEGREILERFPTGAFITVSNHPYGAVDGIILIHLIGSYRDDFKVMVNFFLNNLRAMRPSFIAVDPVKGNDSPEKKKITLQGIREAMAHLKAGHPLGFFPAGAVSKINGKLKIQDREWQPSVIRLIKQMKLPVIPVYFHGHNSTFFNILGLIDWRLRTLRLPRELMNKRGKTIRISIGEPIMPEEQAKFTDIEAFGKFLRQKTYSLE